MFQLQFQEFVYTVTKKRYQMEFSDLIIEPYRNPGDITEGLSDTPVFFIRSKKNEFLFVVKAYSQEQIPLYHLFLKSAQIARGLHLEKSRFTLPFEHFFYQNNEGKIALIALEYAPGESFNSLLRKIRGNQIERRKLLELLSRGYHQVGAAFAELHILTGKKADVGEVFWNRDRKIYHDFLRALETPSFQSSLNKEIVEKNFIALSSQVRESHLLTGILHGDAHPGNLFYHAPQNLLVMTDFDRLSYSINALGNPSGPILEEVIFILASLQFAAKINGLTKEETDLIIHSFMEGYQKEFKSFFWPEIVQRYYQSLFWMRKIFLIASAESGLPKAMQEQINIQREMALEAIKCDLEKV